MHMELPSLQEASLGSHNPCNYPWPPPQEIREVCMGKKGRCVGSGKMNTRSLILEGTAFQFGGWDLKRPGTLEGKSEHVWRKL